LTSLIGFLPRTALAFGVEGGESGYSFVCASFRLFLTIPVVADVVDLRLLMVRRILSRDGVPLMNVVGGLF
jgi:hypothetical protein